MPALAIPPLTPPSSKGHDGFSIASTDFFSRFRPKLIDPNGHFMLGLIQVTNGQEELNKLDGFLRAKDIDQDLTHIDSLNKEKLRKLSELADATKNMATWSAWANVSYYIAAASTLVIGAGCLTLGGSAAVAGYFLVAAGGLGVTNRIVTDTGGWQYLANYFTESHSLQIRISENIDKGLTSVAVALALIGTAQAWHAGHIKLLEASSADMISQVLSKAGTGFSVASHFAASHYQRTISQSKAAINNFSARVDLKYQHVRDETGYLQKALNLQTELNRLISMAIESSSTGT
jgi:hypothetical protein